MSRKKKVIIFTSVGIVAIVLLLIILAFTTFSLKSVTLDFRTSRSVLVMEDEEILQAGDFSKSSVLFYNKNKAKQKMEEKYPYLKVINIETKWPSSFVVHVAERQEVYRVEGEDKNFYLDNELKVLRSSPLEEGEGILLKGVSFNGREGEFLSLDNYRDIYSAFLNSNVNLGMQKEMFKDIEFEIERDENAKRDYLNAHISLYSGQTITILDVDYGLKYKTNLAYNVFSSIYTFIGKEYNISGENVVLTQEMLSGAEIVVQSYYDRASHKESECYFKLNFAQEDIDKG